MRIRITELCKEKYPGEYTTARRTSYTKLAGMLTFKENLKSRSDALGNMDKQVIRVDVKALFELKEFFNLSSLDELFNDNDNE